MPKFFIDPRLQPAGRLTFTRDEHPLGIERASHLTMLFRDLEEARKVYEPGARRAHPRSNEEEMPGRKRSVFYAVGEDTVIEAAQPLSPTSSEGLDMERAGEGIYSVTFKTKDLKRAAEHLRSKGQRVTVDAGSLVIDREDASGMVLRFTERQIPNDPR